MQGYTKPSWFKVKTDRLACANLNIDTAWHDLHIDSAGEISEKLRKNEAAKLRLEVNTEEYD